MTAPDFKVIKGGLKHDIDLQIATGKQVNAVKWHNNTKSWSWLVGRLSDSIRTHETHAEFMKMSKTEQGKIKDVGGFVGGSLKDGRRLAQNVISRQVITLDADFLQEGQSLVDLMLDKYEEGNEVVYGVRNSRTGDSLFKKTFSEFYYMYYILLYLFTSVK